MKKLLITSGFFSLLIFSFSGIVYAQSPTASTAAPVAEPHWNIKNFPEIAINQTNYEDIKLSDYIVADKPDNLNYSLTIGKTNPDWLLVSKEGLLHFIPTKISPEDIDTTQVIYLTATSLKTGKSSPTEIVIKIIPNKQLPAPVWQSGFVLPDAIAGRAYYVNLAAAVDTQQLQDNDQLIFQIVSSSANWLQIGNNGFSLAAKQLPKEEAGKYYEVILRVTSKMSGKSNDYNGKFFVNAAPELPQWQALPAATLNQSYHIDISSLISSNIRNDAFDFNIEVSSLPNWLSITNKNIITGTPREAKLIQQPQKITVTANSKITGMTSKTTLTVNINPDPKLAPQLKQNFLNNPLIGEIYRSNDLNSLLDNHYPFDNLSFEYIDGPDWLIYSPLCNCILSRNNVPNEEAGKTFTIKLRIHSAASGQTLDYMQPLKVYVGTPKWTRTVLPEVKIGQEGILELPINDYTQNDISGDQFQYTLDSYHSPNWVSLTRKGNQTLLIINPKIINPHEVDTIQTVRLFATSQSTQKTSVQLLTINVAANSSLPAPTWRTEPAPIVNVGATHAVDLSEYLKSSIDNDILTIKSVSSDINRISLSNNRLIITPSPRQVGGPFPVTLTVHSLAANTDTLLKMNITVQLTLVANQNMEVHQFANNYQSIVIRGLEKNHQYRLFEVKGAHFDYGPFYSSYVIKTEEDWNNNPFYAVDSDKVIQTGADGVASVIYYSLANNPAPQIELVVLR